MIQHADHTQANALATNADQHGHHAPGGAAAVTRIDMHCHSRASDKPVMAAAGVVGCPECYSEPEQVFDQAMARGMDLVTITDHDTIKGAMELAHRGFERFIVGQEVSVKFPEDGCVLHVLVWGMTPELDKEITDNKLRADVYQFARWVYERNLPHAFAHPLYIQNGRLTRWHVERATLLFKGFETLNGAHSDTLNLAIVRYLDQLTPKRVAKLAEKHKLDPVWPDAHLKWRTGGSDDHALLNVGRSWTQVQASDRKQKITDPQEFLHRLQAGETNSDGLGGHSALLAHQISSVGANYFGRNLYERRSPVGKYVSAKLLRFFGVGVSAPSKKKVAAYKVAQRVWLGKRKKSLPVVRALRQNLRPVLEKYPDLADRLHPDRWIEGTPVSQHERMADFVQDVVAALAVSMAPGTKKALKKRDAGKLAEYAVSYGFLQLAQLPYLISLFYQNKERNFLDRFEHEVSAPGSGVSVLERPMKISLFTDTIADINGVCRFIQNVAERAQETGHDLEVITSTKLECPPYDNIKNFDPVFTAKMPKYDNLDFVLPPLMQILRHVDKHQPDVIHISTPGPVGCIGFIAAKMLRVPVLGVYHTDFPAYIDQLFDDHALTKITSKFMSGFYAPFSSIFTRSDDYVDSLVKLGLPREKIIRLLPGFDANLFHPKYKDQHNNEALWARLGVPADAVKVLYCGRVSVEKNLPFLTKIWKPIKKEAASRGVRAALVVVGDGPYRKEMSRELSGQDVHFLGFRHGEELSQIYASSDLFAFPSTTDTLGQVVMESQGSALPVIVTDIGGPKEVVDNGTTGYVLPATDAGAWIARITDLCCDTELRTKMGAAAHEYMQQFSLEHSFKHFWEVHTQAWHEHLSREGITPETADGANDDETNETRELVPAV